LRKGKANCGTQLAQWPADLSINESKKEMVDLLGPMLRSRLERWKASHGDLPENLLIYRDGVSEGQYQTVLEEELPQLRKVFSGRITLVVVGKRHHTRFYRKEEANETNPKIGT